MGKPTIHQQQEHRRICRDFCAGIGLTILFVVLNLSFEHSPAGRDFGLMVYTWLQRLLVAPEKLPVTVVDISALEVSPLPGGGALTRREPLIDLIEALAAQKPKA